MSKKAFAGANAIFPIISSKPFDIMQYFVFEIMFSKLKIEQ